MSEIETSIDYKIDLKVHIVSDDLTSEDQNERVKAFLEKRPP